MKAIDHTVSREVRAWLRKEAEEQKLRYKKIVAEMEALEPKREKWYREFLERIQTRGFNVHSDMLQQIPADRIPKKPRRKHKVVY